MSDQPPVCDYEGSNYQATFWDTGERAYEDGAEARALRALLPPGGNTLLEVGAGAGRNTPRYTGFNRVVLLDYSRTQLQQAQTRLGHSDRYVYVAADVYRLPFVPGVFEAATMIRVLHHLADPLTALRQVRAALQPEAVFILEFANKRNLKAIARWLLGRQKWNPFTPEAVEFVKLNYDFHPATVRRWLTEAQFNVETARALSYLRLGVLKRHVPLNVLLGIDAVLQPTGAVAPFSPSIFTRARAMGASPHATPDALFGCPTCRTAPLTQNPDHLQCPTCGKKWAVRDGIYDFKEPIEG